MVVCGVIYSRSNLDVALLLTLLGNVLIAAPYAMSLWCGRRGVLPTRRHNGVAFGMYAVSTSACAMLLATRLMLHGGESGGAELDARLVEASQTNSDAAFVNDTAVIMAASATMIAAVACLIGWRLVDTRVFGPAVFWYLPDSMCPVRECGAQDARTGEKSCDAESTACPLPAHADRYVCYLIARRWPKLAVTLTNRTSRFLPRCPLTVSMLMLQPKTARWEHCAQR